MTTETDNVRSPAIEVVPFDPYAAAPLLRWLRKTPPLYLLLFAPSAAAVMIAAAAASHMLGSARNFTPLKDIQMAIRRSGVSASAPFHYPLTRDLPVWIFTIVMTIEVVIMSRQWRLFASGLPRLARNGVIKARPDDMDDSDDSLDDPRSLRTMADCPPAQRLAQYVALVNERNMKRARLYTILFPITALALAALLIWAEHNRIFRVFTPKGMTPAAQEKWRLMAYQHWWSSLNHPIGAAAYFILVALAIYVITVQTHVGTNAARIAAALPRLALTDANWVNPDGYYGWGPLHEIFATVWTSMALYGLIVSVLAIVLGLGGIGWIPACIWLALVAFYFLLPWGAFREIEAAAKKSHIDAAQNEAGVMTTKEQDELETRIKRYRDVRINPMQLGHFKRLSVALSVLLPVVLNLAQPLIQTLISK